LGASHFTLLGKTLSGKTFHNAYHDLTRMEIDVKNLLRISLAALLEIKK
jgi:hypothetical protein